MDQEDGPFICCLRTHTPQHGVVGGLERTTGGTAEQQLSMVEVGIGKGELRWRLENLSCPNGDEGVRGSRVNVREGVWRGRADFGTAMCSVPSSLNTLYHGSKGLKVHLHDSGLW
jgi:hypothetical protein